MACSVVLVKESQGHSSQSPETRLTKPSSSQALTWQAAYIQKGYRPPRIKLGLKIQIQIVKPKTLFLVIITTWHTQKP